MIHYDRLLQNAIDIITKCDSYFTTKCDGSLIQNASGFLLQNATILLQNAADITNCDNFISKCDSYYKMRRLLQIATVHTSMSLILLTTNFKSTIMLFYILIYSSSCSYFIHRF